jgi:hypothetical protein
MIFADGTIDSDMFTYLRDALLLLLFVGGALFLLTSVVLDQDPISSAHSRRTTLVTKDDVLGAASATEAPSGQKLQATLKREQHPGRIKDKRRSIRRGGDPVPVLVTDGLASTEPVPGMVLNRSRGGLCLSVPQRIEVGQLLAVRTHAFPQDLASLQLRVRHCQPTADGWRIGCQFVEELPWNIILMFG